MMIELPSASLRQFEAFTCYNSPYVAHEDASAIDLYPGTVQAPSPVSGEVIAINRVRAPWQPYARTFDYVVGIDTAGGDTQFTADGEPAIARILHLDPTVEVGDTIEIGDTIGTMIRAGFFAPWVANHLHLGFRHRGRDIRRAGGSIPLSLDVGVTPIRWDGSGIVRSVGRTYVELEVEASDRVVSDEWVGLADDEGSILDGGLPHYRFGGILDRLIHREGVDKSYPVHLLGTKIGTATGPTIDWDDISVEANGVPITGVSLFAGRLSTFRVKLVYPGHSFSVGDQITVSIRSTD